MSQITPLHKCFHVFDEHFEQAVWALMVTAKRLSSSLTSFLHIVRLYMYCRHLSRIVFSAIIDCAVGDAAAVPGRFARPAGVGRACVARRLCQEHRVYLEDRGGQGRHLLSPPALHLLA